MNSSDLSNGERLVLDRRRRPSSGRKHESQPEAAKRMDVSHYRYRQWEVDEASPPRVSVGRLADHEACFVYRRRSGMSVEDLSAKLGVTRNWVTEMESGRGNCQRLLAFWRGAETPWRPRRARALAATH